ncbi:hypothetical protein LJR039_004320 [Pseudorhodoferax sp. LjRoot39]|uniref:hypothetical protein n=1 Tax=Pseudorhodoferax sp. LjRoot39 TaxID=3342328 RepID=UPI003ECCD77E
MAARLYLVNGITVQGFVDATGQLLAQNERRDWRKMRGTPSHWMHLPPAPGSAAAAQARPPCSYCTGSGVIYDAQGKYHGQCTECTA